MPIGTAIALGLGIASAAGSVASSAIGAHAAGSAASQQATEADKAAQLQHEDQQAALDFQKQMWDTQQKNLAPWLTAGTQGISTLADLLKTPGSGLLTPYSEKWSAPTGVTEQNDPGYQFRLAEGQKALERGAAARGGALGGAAGKALSRYGQDYASNEYSNVYGRALNDYQTRYNVFENDQSNTYNRLAGLSGAGQSAAANLNSSGTTTAGNVGNIYLQGGNQIAQQMNNAAAARASGIVGQANAWSGGISNGIGNLQQLLLLSKFGGGGNINPGGMYNGGGYG